MAHRVDQFQNGSCHGDELEESNIFKRKGVKYSVKVSIIVFRERVRISVFVMNTSIFLFFSRWSSVVNLDLCDECEELLTCLTQKFYYAS